MGKQETNYQYDWRKLHLELNDRLDLSEIKMICFYMEIEYENIAGSNRSEKIIELLNFLRRSGRVHEFIELCKKERPNFSWEFPGADAASQNEKGIIEQSSDSSSTRKIHQEGEKNIYIEKNDGTVNIGD